MGLHSLVCSGEILDGANGCGLNKSNVRRSLANEHGIRVLKIDKKNGSDPHLVATVREREEDMRICYATYINAFEVRHGNNWTFATLGNCGGPAWPLVGPTEPVGQLPKGSSDGLEKYHGSVRLEGLSGLAIKVNWTGQEYLSNEPYDDRRDSRSERCKGTYQLSQGSNENTDSVGRDEEGHPDDSISAEADCDKLESAK
ncbi:hypothetical protein Tco_1402502 [Tanacetum coccineum]